MRSSVSRFVRGTWVPSSWPPAGRTRGHPRGQLVAARGENSLTLDTRGRMGAIGLRSRALGATKLCGVKSRSDDRAHLAIRPVWPPRLLDEREAWGLHAQHPTTHPGLCGGRHARAHSFRWCTSPRTGCRHLGPQKRCGTNLGRPPRPFRHQTRDHSTDWAPASLLAVDSRDDLRSHVGVGRNLPRSHTHAASTPR